MPQKFYLSVRTSTQFDLLQHISPWQFVGIKGLQQVKAGYATWGANKPKQVQHDNVVMEGGLLFQEFQERSK